MEKYDPKNKKGGTCMQEKYVLWVRNNENIKQNKKLGKTLLKMKKEKKLYQEEIKFLSEKRV